VDHHAIQTIIVALVVGVVSYAVSRKLRIPAILFYLVSGVLLGPVGTGVINAADLGRGLPILVEIGMAIILFEGGLSLHPRRFKTAPAAIQRQLFIVLPLTGAAGGLLAYHFLGISWRLCIVFGALIVVTGPTVIGPLLKSINLPQRVEEILRWESIWGDCMGVLFSALALELLAISHAGDLSSLGTHFMTSILIGTLLGAGGGFLLGRIVLPWTVRLGDPGLPGMITAAAALGLFWGGNAVSSGSGPLAAAVGGFTISYLREEAFHEIRLFKDQISSIFISTLFVLLSSYIDPVQYLDQMPVIILVAAVMGGAVRPLAVQIAMIRTCVTPRERLYLSFIGPRGIIAIATASYASFVLKGHAWEIGMMLNATFAIIFLSGAVATVMGRPLARILKLSVSDSEAGIIIVGVNPVSMAMAGFASKLVPVLFVDTSEPMCLRAEQSGVESRCSNALDDDVYEEAAEEGYRRVIAMTPNDALNSLIVQRAAIHFGRNNVFRAQARPPDDPAYPPPADRTVAFSESYYTASVVEAMMSNRAEIRALDPPKEKDRNRAWYPLLEMKPDNKGLTIVRAGRTPASRTLYVVVDRSIK
jgi:NhaP-type Na+/H+ or K+/H+ antiporter